jgi:hypothetical protein
MTPFAVRAVPVVGTVEQPTMTRLAKARPPGRAAAAKADHTRYLEAFTSP